MELKIGILLPRSDMFPTLALDFLNGMKLMLNSRGNNFPLYKLIVDSIGNATGDSVLKSAEKMILQENVDLTLTFCSIFKLKELVDIFNAYKKPLIHIDLGGNVLKKEHTNPYVIHHTLNLWQSAYLSGVYATKLFGKKATLAVSFYDGGYHLAESFVRGFTENGGKIEYSYVSPMDYKSESFNSMVEGIQKSNPDFVYTLFSFREEEKVLNIISESQLNKKFPFLISPLISVERKNSRKYNLDNMFSISTWDIEMDSNSMNVFKTEYIEEFKDMPNIIAMLGYEVGLSISNCYNNAENIPAKIGDCTNSLEIESPRGKLTFSNLNESLVTLNKVQKFMPNGDNFKNTVLSEVENFNQQKLYDKFKDLPYSGWQNPYIIT